MGHATGDCSCLLDDLISDLEAPVIVGGGAADEGVGVGGCWFVATD